MNAVFCRLFGISCWLMLLAGMSGCGVEYPPIPTGAAKDITSGTPLAEIEAALGDSHPPTSTQARQLDEVIARMPANVRANAQQDATLAWGDDKNFLVVKVNEEGVAWVTAWRSR